MNAVIASQSYSLPQSRNVTAATNRTGVVSERDGPRTALEKLTNPSPPRFAADMQRPVRMRHQSLTEATAVFTYVTNAESFQNRTLDGLDLYA